MIDCGNMQNRSVYDMERYIEKKQFETYKKGQFNNLNIKTIICSFLFIALATTVISFSLLYKPLSSVEGVWVRLPDDNVNASGMVMEIKRKGEIYVGEVVEIDDGNEIYMPLGTNKWKNFQKDGLNAFSYYDMRLSENPAERDYSVSYALMSMDRKKLTMYCPGASMGQHQIWIKR